MMQKWSAQKCQQSKASWLKIPKIIILTKQQHKKFHRVRNLQTAVMGKHTLMSYQQKKYIQKVIPYSPASHDKVQFCSTHPKSYYSLLSGSSCKTKTIIFPLLGEPLTNLKVEQRWGKHIKNWIQKCGNIENILLQAAKLFFNNYENHKIFDLQPDCYRVIDGKLVYIYDTWMNSTLSILASLGEKAPFNLQQLYLSPAELIYLNQRNLKSHMKDSNKINNISLSDFCKKICLFLLNFGVPEIKSRNYQFCQYLHNEQNIKEKLRFFKTRYSHRILTQLIDKLWDHQNVTVSGIQKLFQSIDSIHSTSKSNCGDSFIIPSNKNNRVQKDQGQNQSRLTSALMQNSNYKNYQNCQNLSQNFNKQKSQSSYNYCKKQNSKVFNLNSNSSVFSRKSSSHTVTSHKKQKITNNSQQKTIYFSNLNQSVSDIVNNEVKASKQKLRLRKNCQNYQSVQLNTSEMSHVTKNKQLSSISIIQFKQMSDKHDFDIFNLKKILSETIKNDITVKNSENVSSNVDNGSVCLESHNPQVYMVSKKLIEYLGLSQYIPKNLYEQSVIRMLNQMSMMPDWICQQYPNGSIYFGQMSLHSHQSQCLTDTFSNQCSSQNTKRNGRGLYVFDSLDVYAGDWVNNCMHGQGSYIFKSGQHYEGELQNGLKNGFGKFLYQDQRVYEGYWFKNIKMGMGTVNFPNTVKFFGYFSKGSTTHGIFTRKKNKQILQYPGILQNYLWQQDKFDAQKKQKNLSSKIKKCQLSTYIEHIDESGNKYVGQSQNNKYHGFGIQKRSEQTYEGNWAAGKQDGQGKLIVQNKFEIDAVWKQGILIEMRP